MKFQSPGLECESPSWQKTRRVAIEMSAAQTLISGVVLGLAMSGIGVHVRAVQTGGQEDNRLTPQQDEQTPGLPELNPAGPINIEVAATFKEEEEFSQARVRYVVQAIGQ